MGVGDQSNVQAILLTGNSPGIYCSSGGEGPTDILERCEEEKDFLPPTGIRTTLCPACDESLYQLHYLDGQLYSLL
jgi:hypothetical protein